MSHRNKENRNTKQYGVSDNPMSPIHKDGIDVTLNSSLNYIDKKTQTKEAINHLKNQLAWYKSFFDNATDAVFIVQPETWKVIDANDYAAILLGISREKLIESYLPQFRRIFKLLNKSNSPTVLSELTLDTSGNGGIMVEVSARFVDYETQKLIQAIARDVSEQRGLTDKLVNADKLVLLGQLSAGIAHEIRNPLAAVNLNLQILERELPKDSATYQNVKTALQGVERISKIVEVTINFSKQTVPDIKGMNINSLIKNSLELVSSPLRKKDIKVELALDEELPNIAADAKQMQQVLINLITNAIDAIRAEGNITIKTFIEKGGDKGEEDYVVISIADNGTGITGEDLMKVFNPFFTRKAEGTGLGLPITQRILYNHNGVIDIESTVGKGSTFYVKLPAKQKNEN